MPDKSLLEHDISARRVNAHGSIAMCKSAQIRMDTDPAGCVDAFNPAEYANSAGNTADWRDHDVL